MKTTLLLAIVIFALCGLSFNANAQNVAITDDDAYNADSSAMLDVKSTTKGMLVPRLTTAQRLLISTPATGLLVFDTNEGSFFFYNGTAWANLSSGGDAWTQTGSNLHLADSTNNVGIGTSTPFGKLEVKADASIGINDPIFQVVNDLGDTIFAVYKNGVRVNVEDSPTKASGSKGGFAVGGFSPAKAGVTNEYLRVTPDSVRIYIEENSVAKASGSKGGFAVGGFSPAKLSSINDYLSVNSDSINVSKAMYIPRLTTVERDNLGFVPSEALIIYNTSDDCMQIYKNGVWSNIWCFQCAPIVIIQPFNATICDGEDTSFAVSATGTNLAYQWQKSTDGGVTWNNISNGGSNPTYSGVASVLLSLYNVPVSHHGYLYRCYISASCLPAAYSSVVTLNVGGPSITITSQPQDFQTLANCNASFDISTDAFGNFQWQVSTDGGTIWNNITDGGSAPVYSGVTTDSLSLLNVPLSFANYKYRCVVSSSCGAGTNSNAAFLTINTTTPLATAATNVSYFSFTANWNPVTDATGYFMDISTDINFSSFIPGYNNLFVGNVTTYNVLCLTGGTTYYYRLRAQLLCGTDNSNKITVSTLDNSALAATNISNFSFTANWSVVAGATAYYLDVSTTSDFSSYVTGYSNLNVGDITTYSVSCLSVNTTYYYRIRAQFTCISGNSNIISVTTLNNAAIAATNIFSFSFSANWSSVGGATAYYLDVSTASDFSSFVAGYSNLNVGNVTTYNIICLNTNTTYYYRIRAQLACVTGNSNIISVTTLNNAAIAATNIFSFSFSANWSVVAGATAYYIDVSTASDFSSFVAGYSNLNVGNVTTYSITCLNANTTYYYRIRAQLPCGFTGNSNTITVITLNNAAIPATNISFYSFSANWGSVVGATAYYLDISLFSDFSSFVAGYSNLNVGNVTTYSITCLNANTTYYYRIRAQLPCGFTGNSNAITQSTLNNLAIAATSVFDFSFDANWNPAGDATAYYLDVSSSSDFSSFVTGYNNLNVGNVTTYNVTCLNVNTTYYYRVRTQQACGISENSNTITVSTYNDVQAASNVESNSFSANWNIVGGATAYYIDVSESIDFSTYVTGYNNFNVGNVTTYNVSGLNNQTIYYYRVRADRPCGVSENFNITSLTTHFTIGESYGGGIIFYIDGTELHGLIAAPSDQGAIWGCYGTLITGADGTAIGTGSQNTIDIEAGCATAGTAADIAANLVLNGYDDWYLPSKDELYQLYINKAVVGGFSSNFYWSSSEGNADKAWYQVFSNGYQYIYDKYTVFAVRCVRSF